MWLAVQGGYGEADVFQHSFVERKQGFGGIHGRIGTGWLHIAIPNQLGDPDVVVAEGRRDLTGVQHRVGVADGEQEGGRGGGQGGLTRLAVQSDLAKPPGRLQLSPARRQGAQFSGQANDNVIIDGSLFVELFYATGNRRNLCRSSSNSEDRFGPARGAGTQWNGLDDDRAVGAPAGEESHPLFELGRREGE
jgi:hypothetical protein